eukprot:g2020.t1
MLSKKSKSSTDSNSSGVLVSDDGGAALSDLSKTPTNSLHGTGQVNYVLVQNNGNCNDAVPLIRLSNHVSIKSVASTKSNSVEEESNSSIHGDDKTKSDSPHKISWSSGQETAFPNNNVPARPAKENFNDRFKFHEDLKIAALDHYSRSNSYLKVTFNGLSYDIVSNMFKQGKKIGGGGQTDGIYEATATFASNSFAMRRMRVDPLDGKFMQHLNNEIKFCDEVIADTDLPRVITKVYAYYFRWEKNGKDSDQQSLYFYVIMEKCMGDVHTLFSENYANEELMILFLKDVFSGIKYLHGKRYFHRDIKARNILFGVDEHGKEYFKICDFGFVRGARKTISSVKGLIGTIPYMAPEVINKNQRTTGSDLWAVGITMYELITGELPFADNLEEAALINRIANFGKLLPNINPVQVPPNNIISNSLTNLVNELLIVDPEKRISLDDFLDRLESCNTIGEDIVEEVVENLVLEAVNIGNAKHGAKQVSSLVGNHICRANVEILRLQKENKTLKKGHHELVQQAEARRVCFDTLPTKNRCDFTLPQKKHTFALLLCIIIFAFMTYCKFIHSQIEKQGIKFEEQRRENEALQEQLSYANYTIAEKNEEIVRLGDIVVKKDEEITVKDDDINGYVAVLAEKDEEIDTHRVAIAEKDGEIENLQQQLTTANDIMESLRIQTKTYACGNVYVGQMKDGKLHGFGKLTLANGDVYVGDFKDNMMHGYGKYTFADGSILYDGMWKDGKRVMR